MTADASPNTRIDMLYLSEPEVIAAGMKDMAHCMEVMEDVCGARREG